MKKKTNRKSIVGLLSTSVAFAYMISKTPKTNEYENKKKERTTLALLYQWNDNLRNGKRIEDYLVGMGAKRIAIYGSGELGFQLSKELNVNGKVQVLAYIDREKKYEDDNGVHNISLEDISEWDDSQCDMIVVTPLNDYKLIKKQLSNLLSDRIKIVSIEDIIFDM